MKKKDTIDLKVKCPECNSEDITDHEKVGLDAYNRYFCHECGRMWGSFNEKAL
jgi:transposase-like protein